MKTMPLARVPGAPVIRPVSSPQPSQGRFDNQRSDSDFIRAKRHSRLVILMRKLLPISAVCLVVAFAIMVALTANPLTQIAIGSLGIEDGNLVMHSPAMKGLDNKNRPYDLRAKRAFQNLKQPKIVTLEQIEAQIPLDNSPTATLSAKVGTYDTDAETPILKGNVVVRGARGMDIDMQQADIDMKLGTMHSDEPVKVKSDRVEITADSIQVEDNGQRIVFTNRVRTTIDPQTVRSTASPTDLLQE